MIATNEVQRLPTASGPATDGRRRLPVIIHERRDCSPSLYLRMLLTNLLPSDLVCIIFDYHFTIACEFRHIITLERARLLQYERCSVRMYKNEIYFGCPAGLDVYSLDGKFLRSWSSSTPHIVHISNHEITMFLPLSRRLQILSRAHLHPLRSYSVDFLETVSSISGIHSTYLKCQSCLYLTSFSEVIEARLRIDRKDWKVVDDPLSFGESRRLRCTEYNVTGAGLLEGDELYLPDVLEIIRIINLQQWKVTREIALPRHAACTALVRSGSELLSGYCGGILALRSKDGKLMRQFNPTQTLDAATWVPGECPKELHPTHMALDERNQLYVVDGYRNRILVFD
jgi:hypothetical protein